MKESGKHGKVGFYWENAGCVQLAKKTGIIAIA